MRKIMIALPALLVSGLVMAEGAPRADGLQGADSVLLAAALDAARQQDAPVIHRGEQQLEAANDTPAAPKPAEPTPADNSKRFHMTQDGKRMTAEDFDAWMKKNGYRVATGAPAKLKDDASAKPNAEAPAKGDSK